MSMIEGPKDDSGYSWSNSLRKKCPYSELFWSTFSRIRENVDQNNSEYGHFLRSDYLQLNFFLKDIINFWWKVACFFFQKYWNYKIAFYVTMILPGPLGNLLVCIFPNSN